MRKNVLVVDDSAIIRSLLISTIETLDDIETFEAANGFEALKALPTQSFDLMLIDINMPEINGLELVHFVKNHPDYRNIPVMIVSTEREEVDIRKALALGARRYITKPFDPDQLKQAVKELLKPE
ncbi:MAG: response regulator [Candidatus Manganitrophaceae bacterium]